MDYAIYKGDKFLFVGTKKECAEFLKVKEDTISFYTTPTHKSRVKDEYNNRTIVIKIQKEEI